MTISKSFDLIKMAKILNAFAIICSILLLVSLSIDVIEGLSATKVPGFMHFQLFVCIIFLLDLCVRCRISKNKWKFWAVNWIILLVSIPFLNILTWLHIDNVPPYVWMIAKALPLIRGFYALALIATWMTHRSVQGLAFGYLFAVIGFTYLSALIFFAAEKGINPHVDTFGNCLWWGFMNVTTVGAAIFAVTTVGKILSVLLPFLGMVMLPLFTAYAIEFFKKQR